MNGCAPGIPGAQHHREEELDDAFNRHYILSGHAARFSG